MLQENSEWRANLLQCNILCNVVWIHLVHHPCCPVRRHHHHFGFNQPHVSLYLWTRPRTVVWEHWPRPPYRGRLCWRSQRSQEYHRGRCCCHLWNGDEYQQCWRWWRRRSLVDGHGGERVMDSRRGCSDRCSLQLTFTLSPTHCQRVNNNPQNETFKIYIYLAVMKSMPLCPLCIWNIWSHRHQSYVEFEIHFVNFCDLIAWDIIIVC